MKTKVNRFLIDKWVEENSPNGVYRLAQKSGLSASLISRIRIGYVPTRHYNKQALAKALNVKTTDLFKET